MVCILICQRVPQSSVVSDSHNDYYRLIEEMKNHHSLYPDQWSTYSLLINSEWRAHKKSLSALSLQRICSRMNCTDFLPLVSLCFLLPSRFSLSSLIILLHILWLWFELFSMRSLDSPCSIQCSNPFSNKLVWAGSVPTYLGERECYIRIHDWREYLCWGCGIAILLFSIITAHRVSLSSGRY